MRHCLATLLMLSALSVAAVAADTPKLTGSWEAAHAGGDSERIYLVLKDMGKAEIITEYDFTLPGQPGKRRGRSTTFGKWKVKGNDVTVTYAKITESLRYVEQVSLKAVGLSGTAPALQPTGKASGGSKIGSAILWKGPHDYRVQGTEPQPAVGDKTTSAAPADAAPK